VGGATLVAGFLRDLQVDEALAHLLPGPEHLGPFLEGDLNHRQAEDGTRADRLATRNAGQGHLRGNGDLPLDLFGRPAGVSGDDRHADAGDVRIGLDLGFREGPDARNCDHGNARRHGQR